MAAGLGGPSTPLTPGGSAGLQAQCSLPSTYSEAQRAAATCPRRQGCGQSGREPWGSPAAEPPERQRWALCWPPGLGTGPHAEEPRPTPASCLHKAPQMMKCKKALVRKGRLWHPPSSSSPSAALGFAVRCCWLEGEWGQTGSPVSPPVADSAAGRANRARLGWGWGVRLPDWGGG